MPTTDEPKSDQTQFNLAVNALIKSREGIMELQPEIQALLERQGKVARELRLTKSAAECAVASGEVDKYSSVTFVLFKSRTEMQEIRDELRQLTKLCDEVEEEMRTAFLILLANPDLKS
ncbi:uncharacterized protein BCR38DRAFT_443904 [Pseudomassariella vexata]|uniref:Uncharacterized protein n=1 Tax=Pseudomassariella vexata TaxID=1141098 RepID=A0A1Y2DLS4_9PEZI|nr:uncharacterized protein BCR38DRAFT_443904 [Pseudomassariella vexata]ORY60089.1 hypothetical protein BCR38DRAFT_443904 [Pseudomassariella vexata]